MTARQRLAADDGTTLIEVLIASMIFAIGGLMLVGGFYTAMTVGDMGAKHARLEAVGRSAAETVKEAPYDPACGYTVTVPDGFVASTSARAYPASTRDLSGAGGGCGPADATQVVSITIRTADDVASGTVDVVKRPS